MPFRTQEQYFAIVISIEGNFKGITEGTTFLEAINDLIDHGKIHVVVDLSKTEHIDSTGIGALIKAVTTLRNAGGDLRLAGLEKRIKTIFLTTRLLGRVFTEYYSVESALDSFRLDPPRFENIAVH